MKTAFALSVVLVSSVLLLATAGVTLADSDLACADLPYVKNVFPTTVYGPAAADVITASTNFLACTQGTYALCYYAGAKGAPCKLDEDGSTAHCQCEVFQASADEPYYVDINAILNTCIYVETIAACGHDGSLCTEPDSAPVCDYIAANKFNPDAQVISTFSFQTVGDFNIGCTDCSGDQAGVYAGCMTAPCTRGNADNQAICACPTFDGPYQFGRRGEQYTCNAGEGLVWSAAYNPDGCGGVSVPSKE
ncbi:MAG: hypothetical protein AAGD38_20605 [Acidobacteriota bacterium]